MTKTCGATSTTEDVLSGIDLHGKRILATGASAGIGVETARALAAHGAHVVGAARDLPAFPPCGLQGLPQFAFPSDGRRQRQLRPSQIDRRWHQPQILDRRGHDDLAQGVIGLLLPLVIAQQVVDTPIQPGAVFWPNWKLGPPTPRPMPQ